MADATYRVIVTGCRDWTDEDAVVDLLERQHDEARARRLRLVVVHGACPTGADKFASDWCRKMRQLGLDVDEERHPADWNKHKRSAGMIRNAGIAKLGGRICGAFWDSKSPGTRNMIEQCTRNGVPVWIEPKELCVP